MGFDPAAILVSDALPNLVATHYERQAIPNLKANTPFMGVTKQRPLPLHSGNKVQFYTYALLASNTDPATEGSVGDPVAESTTKIAATIGQYADFINSSDLSMEVAIDDPALLQNLAGELNYRLALTLNKLVIITADSADAIDGDVNIDLANGSYLTAGDIRSAVQSLKGVNARPLSADGRWGGLIHPAVVQDVLNDASANGLTDILKRDPAGQKKLLGPLSDDDVFEFAGVRFQQTTTCPSATVDSQTKFNTYVVGEDAIFSVFLGKNPQNGTKNYKLMIQNAPANGSSSDPARQVGGWVSYNVKYTNTLRPGTTQTLRVIESETQGA
jgi:N4-gp56 family major capsid protein